MSKIHLCLEGLTDALMGGKLVAIVGGIGMGVCLIGPQPIHRLAGDFGGLLKGLLCRSRYSATDAPLVSPRVILDTP